MKKADIEGDYSPKFGKTDKMEDKRKANKKEAVKGPKVLEKVIQAQVESYLKNRGQAFIRLPDSMFMAIYGFQGIPQWIKTMVSKYLAGLPDLIIPLITGDDVLILSLELKSKGGKIGPKQEKWAKVLNTKFAYSTEEAIEYIDNFLEGG